MEDNLLSFPEDDNMFSFLDDNNMFSFLDDNNMLSFLDNTFSFPEDDMFPFPCADERVPSRMADGCLAI